MRSLVVALLITFAAGTTQAQPQGWLAFSQTLPYATMSVSEKAIINQCKREAQSVFISARAVYPQGSLSPDIKATTYMHDCMVQRAP